MRKPRYPLDLIVKAQGTGKLTRDDRLELVVSLREHRDACNILESQVSSLLHERDKLLAENQFLIKLFNIKENQE